MKKNLGYIVLLLLVTLTYGCGGSDSEEPTPDPVDSKNPEMTISAPAEGATVLRGSDLTLSGTFTDDMELESLTVTLSFNDTKAFTGIDDPWEPAGSPETIVLSGTEDTLTNLSLFGESIAADCKVGSYVLTLDLKDKSGKMTSQTINVVVGG